MASTQYGSLITHDEIEPRGDSSSKPPDQEDTTCSPCSCLPKGAGARACQWIARIILLVLVSASLFASRLSFAILVAQFGIEHNDSNRTNASGYGSDESRSKSDGVFWLLLLVVCVPYIFSLLRCAYRGLLKTRRIIIIGLGSSSRRSSSRRSSSRRSMPSPARGITVYPWPKGGKFVLGIGLSILEGLLVATFVIVIAPQMSTASEIAALPAVIIPLPIAISAICFIHIRAKKRASAPESKNACWAIFKMSGLLAAAVVSIGVWIGMITLLGKDRTPWVAFVLLSIIWLPHIQKFILGEKEDDEQSKRWMEGIINGLSRLVSVIGFAMLMLLKVQKRSSSSLSVLNTEMEYIAPFLISLGSSLCAYLLSWLAFRVNMDCFGFYMPLLASSIASIVFLFLPSLPCRFSDALDVIAATYCNDNGLDAASIALIVLEFGEILAIGIVAYWRLHLYPLVREEEVFIHPYCTGPFAGQALIVNLKTALNFEDNINPPKKKMHVIIASTMYQESRDEQERLFESIQALYEKKKSDTNDYQYEWHIWFDNAVRGDQETRTNKFVKTLIDIFKDNNAAFNSRYKVPYGLQIHVKLGGGKSGGGNGGNGDNGDNGDNGGNGGNGSGGGNGCGGDGSGRSGNGSGSDSGSGDSGGVAKPNFPVVIHLKDTTKWKQKKRWSQVMYMNYVCEFLCDKSELQKDKSKPQEENYVLTTDGDVEFNPEDVDILLDRLNMDERVGSVSGRVYPVGKGAVVWYQKFEYAAGYWLQKVAEHVLGTVLCSPGCFSAFRVKALDEVLPEYSKNVVEASDFLKMDMGEDRWLSTLLIRNRWRLDYTASSKCKTKCPETFDEFYKQRRRWIPSTLANLFYLGSESFSTWQVNEAYNFVFMVYVIFFILSSIIGPSTILLVMAAGLEYAFLATDNRYVVLFVSIPMFTVVILFYVWVCVYCCEETQLFVAKVLTFFSSFLMAVVIIGVILQVVENLKVPSVTPPTDRPFIIIPPGNPSPNASSAYDSLSLFGNSSSNSFKLELPGDISLLYLGGMISIFITAALLHLGDFFVLFIGILYLFCLPSGFIFLTIFAVCNLTNQTWGTRENSEQSGKKTLHRRFLEGLKTLRKYCCFCSKELNLEAIPLTKNDDKKKKDEMAFCIKIKDDNAQNSKIKNLEDILLPAEKPLANIKETTFWKDLPTKIDIDTPRNNGKKEEPGQKEEEPGKKEEEEEPGKKEEEELEKKLKKLRSSWLLIFLTVNTLWTAVIAVLELHPALMVGGSNALGTMFLLVYGIMFTVQFLACIWNRLETLIHYLSRRNSQESWFDRFRYQSGSKQN